MNTYSYTYWPPGGPTGGSIGTVTAKEFAFTDQHVLFLGEGHVVVLAIPLALTPVISFRGAAT